MRSASGEPPDDQIGHIRTAIELMRALVEGEIDAARFETAFLKAWHSDGEPEGSIAAIELLERVFWDVEDFVPEEIEECIRDTFVHDEPDENSRDIDADELRRRVAAHLAAYDRYNESRSVVECLHQARRFLDGKLDVTAFESAFLKARTLPDEEANSIRGERFLHAVFLDIGEVVHDDSHARSADDVKFELKGRVTGHLWAYIEAGEDDR